ncbi:hypothetical protein GWI33_014793 [Rhynchophorus ferrugineus]|uniref:Uncharacterized protein n=1 Tax=Rhynchophorus ferrugineus TaxID=354439 RepID=A0A834I4E7_RHYFE|nr:hypothetical protein GWI33_014793 [Rhynchophorus ferrugineus]
MLVRVGRIPTNGRRASEKWGGANRIAASVSQRNHFVGGVFATKRELDIRSENCRVHVRAAPGKADEARTMSEIVFGRAQRNMRIVLLTFITRRDVSAQLFYHVSRSLIGR